MAGSAASDHEYDNDGALIFSGSANTYVAGTARKIKGYYAGFRCCGRIPATSTGASTITVDEAPSIAIRKNGNTAIGNGDLVSGAYYDFVYDAANNVMQAMVTSLAAITAASIGAVAKAGDTMTGVLTISPGNSVANADWLILQPTDWATDKPYFSIKKSSVADKYEIILWDGTDTNGIIDVICSSFRFQTKSLVPNVVAATPYVASTNITTVIPYDDTIPLSTEGDQILTASITLTATSSRVLVQFTGFGSNTGTGEQATAALFRGTTCIDVTTGEMRAANATVNLAMTVVDSPATAGAVTYTVRAGPSANTMRLNGTGAARKYGGAAAATLTLTELAF